MLSISNENKNLVINGDNIFGMKLIDGIRYYDFIFVNAPSINQNKSFNYKDSLGDKWIDILTEILSISKNLMTDKGSVALYVCSEEYLMFKEIMDKIFGSKNYRNSFLIKRNENTIDFLLVYSKTDNFILKKINNENIKCVSNLHNYSDFALKFFKSPDDKCLRKVTDYIKNEKHTTNIHNDINNVTDIVNLFTEKNSKILDCFAGIGDTFKAVLDLNENDRGNRIVTSIINNSNNIIYDVCSPRIRELCETYNKDITYICLN